MRPDLDAALDVIERADPAPARESRPEIAARSAPLWCRRRARGRPPIHLALASMLVPASGAIGGWNASAMRPLADDLVSCAVGVT
jgi:hypothetical protein